MRKADPQKPPNPGTDAAIDQGCTCPIIDNRGGRGFMVNGQRCFWMDDKCPLHAKKAGADVKA